MAVWLGVAGVVSAFLIRGQVTPVANPHDNEGNRLRADEFIAP